jgi:hypothetical protein
VSQLCLDGTELCGKAELSRLHRGTNDQSTAVAKRQITVSQDWINCTIGITHSASGSHRPAVDSNDRSFHKIGRQTHIWSGKTGRDNSKFSGSLVLSLVRSVVHTHVSINKQIPTNCLLWLTNRHSCPFCHAYDADCQTIAQMDARIGGMLTTMRLNHSVVTIKKQNHFCSQGTKSFRSFLAAAITTKTYASLVHQVRKVSSSGLSA